MTKPILKYEILEEKGILIRYLQGEIGLNSLYSLMLESGRDKRFKKDYVVLYDMRDAEFVIKKETIEDFLANVRGNADFLVRKRVAFLTMNPNQVIFPNCLTVWMLQAFFLWVHSQLYRLR